MDDLITWLKAQLDDDQRIATHDGLLAGDTWQVMEPLPGRVTAEVMRVGGSVAKLEHHDAEHMARHDPARVLREVQAKRKIIAAHQQVGSDDDPYCSVCYQVDWETTIYGDWPCDTLKLLALPFDDRPGYRSEWAL